MQRLVGIYQPFYKPALIERLDSGFIPLDWLSNPAPAQRELALHHHVATRKIYSSHGLTGLLSPKFVAKTRLSSQAAVRLNWSAKERQSSDPDDFDLLGRYPDPFASDGAQLLLMYCALSQRR